jgi:hypothetical protein
MILQMLFLPLVPPVLVLRSLLTGGTGGRFRVTVNPSCAPSRPTGLEGHLIFTLAGATNAGTTDLRENLWRRPWRRPRIPLEPQDVTAAPAP